MNKEENKNRILKLLTIVPMISTSQAATFFSDAGSPNKRASELLKRMETDGLIEGRRRLDKPKVWRLSKRGREAQHIAKRPVPFTSRKIDHHLAVGDVLLHLRTYGKLTRFDVEPQFDAGATKYYPDAYFVFNDRAYLLEVQTSPMSSTQWDCKWQVARNSLKKVRWEKDPVKIITISRQQKGTVGGKGLPVLVVPVVADFVQWEAWLKI